MATLTALKILGMGYCTEHSSEGRTQLAHWKSNSMIKKKQLENEIIYIACHFSDVVQKRYQPKKEYIKEIKSNN